MGATKTHLYKKQDIDNALLGRAFAHPARIAILTKISQNQNYRSVDLAKYLKLSKTSVHDHLKKLEEANLIAYNFKNDECYIFCKTSSIVNLFNDMTEMNLRVTT